MKHSKKVIKYGSGGKTKMYKSGGKLVMVDNPKGEGKVPFYAADKKGPNDLTNARYGSKIKLMRKGASIKKMNMSGLSNSDMDKLNKHSKHHSNKHMKMMIKLMMDCVSFNKSHEMAMEKTGK